MGIRAALNRKPVAVLALLLILTPAVAWSIYFFRQNAASPGKSAGPRWWYTTDEGKTFFADAPGKLIPFERNGKTAFRCYVWTCDGGKTKFVSHLERVKPELAKAYPANATINPLELPPGSLQVKAPGAEATGWVDAGSPPSFDVTTPRCPDGGIPQGVLPE